MRRLQPSFEEVFRDLIEFALRPEFAAEMERATREYFGATRPIATSARDADETAFLEWFVLDRPLADGVGAFVENYLDATAAFPGRDREDVAAWSRSSVSFYGVVEASSEAVRLRDLANPRRHEVRVPHSGGDQVLHGGELIMARLLPWAGAMHFGGALNIFPPSAHASLLGFLADVRRQTRGEDWSRVLKEVLPALSRFQEEPAPDEPLFPGGYPDRISPLTVDTWMDHGRSCLERGAVGEALVTFQRVLFEDPSHLGARSYVGLVYLSQGDYASARRAFESILAEDPDHVLALLNLGNTLLASGRLDEAHDLLARARVASDDAAVRSHACFNLGLVYLLSGQDAAAFRSFSEASRLAERAALPPDEGPSEAAAFNLRIGTNLTASERWEPALTYLRKSVRLDPSNGEALLALAEACVRTARWREATAAYRRALRTGHGGGKPWNALGRCYLQLAQYRRAEEALRRCVEVLPGLVEGHVHLGQALLGQGRLDEARRRFEVALYHAPRCVDALLHAAEASLGLTDPRAAERYLRKALRIAPDDDRLQRILEALEQPLTPAVASARKERA